MLLYRRLGNFGSKLGKRAPPVVKFKICVVRLYPGSISVKSVGIFLSDRPCDHRIFMDHL